MELVRTEGLPPMEAFEQDLSDLSEGTQRLYRRWLDNFLEYIKGTPEELIAAITEAENRALALKSIRKTIKKYQDELVEGGLNRNTVSVVAKSVTKFLVANEINDFKMKAGRNSAQSKGKRVLLKEQIVSLYEDAGRSRRLRALVLTIKDSGFRPSDIVKMTVEDFINARKIQTDKGEFRVWAEPILTQKNKVYAHLHLGPESVRSLIDYIGDRTQGAIFLTERSMPRKDGSYTRPGEAMKSINVTTCLRTLCKHLKSQGFNVSGISLRKFFFTNLSTRFDVQYTKILAGKALSKTDAPYLQAALTGQLTELYIEHYDVIRVFDEGQVSKEEVKSLKAEVEGLRQEISEWTRDTSEMGEYMTDLEKIIGELRGLSREEVIRKYMKTQAEYDEILKKQKEENQTPAS